MRRSFDVITLGLGCMGSAVACRVTGRGLICGFGTLSKFNDQIAATCVSDGKVTLTMSVITASPTSNGTLDTRVASEPIQGTDLCLQTDMDFKKNKGICFYGLDEKTWTPLRGEFDLAYDWQAGIFQGNSSPSSASTRRQSRASSIGRLPLLGQTVVLNSIVSLDLTTPLS